MENSITAIIPARSGSKSIADKNIRLLNGKPLIAYSIESALKSKKIDRVIVSTDSEEYAAIAKSYGAEVPFMRPKNIAGDSSLDIEVFQHALQWLSEHNERPSILVHLRPTHPIRMTCDIDNMIDMLIENASADSVRSVSPAKQIPYKMWTFADNNIIKPVAVCEIAEAYNAPRQILPAVYMQNASIDVMRYETIAVKKSMTGEKILGYAMNYDFDIDTEDEFLRAEQYISIKSRLDKHEKITVCCDIDGVVASKTPNNDYAVAAPMVGNIEIINKLADNGHEIILFTARGYVTGIDWAETTESQMKKWGVKYSKLLFGKPAADVYVDDRNISLYELKNLALEE